MIQNPPLPDKISGKGGFSFSFIFPFQFKVAFTVILIKSSKTVETSESFLSISNKYIYLC